MQEVTDGIVKLTKNQPYVKIRKIKAILVFFCKILTLFGKYGLKWPYTELALFFYGNFC
jgi:hypothetical protein